MHFSKKSLAAILTADGYGRSLPPTPPTTATAKSGNAMARVCRSVPQLLGPLEPITHDPYIVIRDKQKPVDEVILLALYLTPVTARFCIGSLHMCTYSLGNFFGVSNRV